MSHRISIETAEAEHMVIHDHEADFVDDLDFDPLGIIVWFSVSIVHRIESCQHDQELELHEWGHVKQSWNHHIHNSLTKEHGVVRNLFLSVKHAHLCVKIAKSPLKTRLSKSIHILLEHSVEDEWQHQKEESRAQWCDDIVVRPVERLQVF